MDEPAPAWIAEIRRRAAAVERTRLTHHRNFQRISHNSTARTIEQRNRDVWATPEAVRTLSNFSEAMDNMYREMWEVPSRLSNGDIEAVEAALRFLEADPWCFRSGYMKENLLRGLRKVSLDSVQLARLRRVILGAVLARHGREFRYYCNSAVLVDDNNLRTQLADLRDDEDLDESVRRRAEWMLLSLERRDPGKVGGRTSSANR